MKLISADFVTSAAAGGRADGIPHDGLAQVAMAGRSNVGKSTLINALCRLKVARTSAAPGKTRLANLYRFTVEGGAGGPGRWSAYIVDLPGYGYARGGASSAEELRAVAEAYFRAAADARRLTMLLVDARHPGLETDVAAARWLDGMGANRKIVATKVDKLSRTERARNLRIIGDVFGMAALPVSATSGEGLDALWTTIATLARDVVPRG
ncbi:MAG: ribosome biogenesis GTP-binding protein YihA/YsxC [Vicinamibacterales bacterium]